MSYESDRNNRLNATSQSRRSTRQNLGPDQVARRREADYLASERRRAQRDYAAAASRSDAHIREQNRNQNISRSRRVVEPLTSEESYNRTRRSQATYERARRSRAADSISRELRGANRDVIDGRGSVDSRAFNELNELVGYSVDKRDRPNPAVDSSNQKTKWHSHAGQGFGSPDASMKASNNARKRRERSNAMSQARQTGIYSGTSSQGGPLDFIAALPLFVKIAVPVIVVLFIVLIILIFG